MPPAVSVIVATYNRSAALSCAIESVRRSDLSDWELIVVGDHCTDDTADVVASFADARLSYVNLPENCGDQSGPNNEGLRRARGRYVAFLNHDDMYFPDHLSACIDLLEREGADMVWNAAAVPAAPRSREALASGRWTVELGAIPPGEDYTPTVYAIASCWVMGRALADRVGPWREPAASIVPPSQDWIFRAWRSGARIRFLPRVTVLLLFSGRRPGSYARPADYAHEHEFYAGEMLTDARFRERLVMAAAVTQVREQTHRPLRAAITALYRLALRPVQRALLVSGRHPRSVSYALRFGLRRGAFIRAARRKAGLGDR